MTEAEIQRLRGLCLAMTPLLDDAEVEFDEDEFWAVKGLDSYGMDCVAECENEGDARFIAAAREAMPKLLDEVERLRELANEARQSIAALVTKTNNVFMERHFRTVLDKLEGLSNDPLNEEKPCDTCSSSP